MILNGLNGSNYENTVAIGQMKVEPNQSLAVEIQNYATNYYSTGNSDIDLDGALNQLNKKKKEVEGEIRKSLQEKQQRRYAIEQETTYLWRDIHKLEQEIEEVDGKIGKEEARREGRVPKIRRGRQMESISNQSCSDGSDSCGSVHYFSQTVELSCDDCSFARRGHVCVEPNQRR